MPETEFFANAQDEEAIVARLFELEFTLIPDIAHATTEMTFIREFHAYVGARSRTSLFFAINRNIIRSPLNVIQIPGSGWNGGKYAIRQREGGPSLFFTCFRNADRKQVLEIGAGSIGYYATYKNTANSKQERPPSNLIVLYRNIRGLIQEQGHLIRFEGIRSSLRDYWILPQALESLRNGATLPISLAGVKKVHGIEGFSGAIHLREG